MGDVIKILVPAGSGKAEVRMPFRSDNRVWLHAAIETRRPEWVGDSKKWLVPRVAAQRIFDAATEDGRGATLTRVFKPDTDKCTEMCQAARLDTVGSCTCICGGSNHGRSSPGWKSAGAYLLVRPNDGLITQTISNEFA